MKAVRIISGRGVPLKRSDVDTDQIIPAEWLKRVERTGFEKGLFSTWRDDRNFVLNDERYAGASILVAGKSFGVGSSREHAVWAIQQGGFNAVIAPSFSDIFRNNCGKNGLIVVELSEETVAKLWQIIETNPQTEITVDVERLTVEVPSCGVSEKFAMNPDTQNRFLKGLDDIAISLQHVDANSTCRVLVIFSQSNCPAIFACTSRSTRSM
jgi:3-isopropylmalate/(R)-2-methylmalate dehydratase small subunit